MRQISQWRWRRQHLIETRSHKQRHTCPPPSSTWPDFDLCRRDCHHASVVCCALAPIEVTWLYLFALWRRQVVWVNGMQGKSRSVLVLRNAICHVSSRPRSKLQQLDKVSRFVCSLPVSLAVSGGVWCSEGVNVNGNVYWQTEVYVHGSVELPRRTHMRRHGCNRMYVSAVVLWFPLQ